MTMCFGSMPTPLHVPRRIRPIRLYALAADTVGSPRVGRLHYAAMSAATPSPIGPEQAALIARRVSITVASRDAALRPHLMRAVGCRLSADLSRVTLLLPRAGSLQLVEDVRENRHLAVVFSEPSTNRTLQLKGTDAIVATCGPDDVELARRHVENFAAEIGRLGFAAEVAQTSLGHDDELVAVHFTVGTAFEQTPGPSAGEPLAKRPR